MLSRLVILFFALLVVEDGFGQTPWGMGYFHSQNDIVSKRVNVIPSTPKEIVVTGKARRKGNVLYDRFVMFKTDDNGVPLNGLELPYEMEKHDIITTQNNGILLAGMPEQAYVKGYGNLMVTMFDQSLSQQWSINIPLRVRSYMYGPEDVSIEKVYDPVGNREFFYIAFTAGDQCLGSEWGFINVVKIEDNGTLIWHKMYTYNITPPPGGTWDYFNDGVNDIAKFPSGNDWNFCIAGAQSRTLRSTGQERNDLFFMTIDENGGIVMDYRIYSRAASTRRPDIVFDNASGQFACVYEDLASINAPCMPSPLDKVGVMTFDPVVMTISNETTIHNCDVPSSSPSITLNAVDNYVVSLHVQQQGRGVFYFIEMDAGLTMLNSWHYLDWTDMDYHFAKEHFTDAGTDDHYAVPSKSDLSAGSPFYVPVLIKAASNLDNPCGNIHWLDQDPITGPFDILLHDICAFDMLEPYEFGMNEFSLEYQACDGLLRQSVTTHIKDKKTNSAEIEIIDQQIQAQINSSTKGEVKIAVFNTMGQLLAQRSQVVSEGTTRVEIAEHLATGVYYVKLLLNGQQIKTRKVTVVK